MTVQEILDKINLPEDQMQVEQIPMCKLYADHSFNCRGKINKFDVADLINSIEGSRLLQPIVVRPLTEPERERTGMEYGVVCGFRRHTAFKAMKRERIPAIVVTNISEEECRILNLKENLQRENLNILEEAKAIEHFHQAGQSLSWIADKVVKPRQWVEARSMLLNLEPEIQECAAAGIIKSAHIRDLYAVKDKTKRIEMVHAIKNAVIRGNSASTVTKAVKKKESVLKHRGQQEIFVVQDLIRETVGNNILTRMLGWCAGCVNDKEMYDDLAAWIKTTYGSHLDVPPEFR